MHDTPAIIHRASSVKHQPRSNRYYFDVGIGSVCLSGADSGGAYCLLEVGLAPEMSVPRHTHTREDEAYFVLVGELEVTVGDEIFILRPGDSLMAPRDIPHQLRNSGNVPLSPSVLAVRVRGISEGDGRACARQFGRANPAACNPRSKCP